MTSNNDDAAGDTTLLETMVGTLIVEHVKPDTTGVHLDNAHLEKYECDAGETVSNYKLETGGRPKKDEQLGDDLARILASHYLTEPVGESDSLEFEGEDQNIYLETLYHRAQKSGQGQESISTTDIDLIEKRIGLDDDDFSKLANFEPPVKPCLLTKNDNYRSFMEEVMFLKCCSKEILQSLENSKNILNQNVGIKGDTSFGKIHEIQAWSWICQDAIQISARSICDDKKRKKKFKAFTSNLFTRIGPSFKRLHWELKRILKTYLKLDTEFSSLMQKSLLRFCYHLDGARDYELSMSGFNFFLHPQTDSTESFTEYDITDVETKATHEKLNPVSLECGLQVRMSIEGVTIRSMQPDSKWLKLQSMEIDKEREFFLQNFVDSLCRPCEKALRSAAIISNILQDSRSKLKDNTIPQTILQSIRKCKGILHKPHKISSFLPQEVFVVLYGLKAARAVFDLINPILVDVMLLTEKLVKITSDIYSKRKSLVNGKSTVGIPLERHSRFEMEIRNSKVNFGAVLYRCPIYYTKQQREKITAQSSDVLCDDDIIEDMPIETLYAQASQTFYTPSTQELAQSFRKSISAEQFLTINPACYLFNDLEPLYHEMTKTLMKTRNVEVRMLNLCSDPIRNFYRAAETINKKKERVLENLQFAIEHLLYIPDKDFKSHNPNSVWFQLLCKSLQVWDFHALPKHIQVHFRTVNEKSIRWIERLEEAFGQVAQCVSDFKEEFLEHRESLEKYHALDTWIPTKNNPRHTKVPIRQAETMSRYNKLDSEITVKFCDYDMKLIESNLESNTNPTVLSLNKIHNTVQLGLISVPFTQIDESISRAIVTINSALALQERHININELKMAIPINIKSQILQNIHQLENLILTLSFEMVNNAIQGTIGYIGMLDNAISQFSRMFQMIQLYLEDREFISSKKTISSSKRDRKTFLKTPPSQMEMDHLQPAGNLNETLQLLRSSIDTMPEIFKITDGSLKKLYLKWIHIAKKDSLLMEKIHPTTEISSVHESVQNEESNFDLAQGLSFKLNSVAFEEAMTRTTTGKAFFPDPLQFSSDIELWRTFCFKMLSAAVDKFRELTTTKIIDTKTTLNYPQVSQTVLELKSPEFEHQSIEKLSPISTPVSTPIGYTEGLCSLLCFITRQLSARDRVFVSMQDLKRLKEKFYTVTNLVEKFKKDLDGVERVLINSLSLTMASIEYKRLPHDLPVSPNAEDFLKSHDLEEVGSKRQDDPSSILLKAGKDHENPDQDFIELHWDTSSRQKLFCKSKMLSSTPIDFSQLHVSGQLYIANVIIDELIQEFQKARELVKESKVDISFAKTLLAKTWKGIGRDMKKGRIPDSGVLVLVKLYRHQIATAVINTKATKRTAREVRYLLSQCAQSTKFWVEDQAGLVVDRNYIMDSDNLSITVTLKTHMASEGWLVKDEDKVTRTTLTKTKSKVTPLIKLSADSQDILEIKHPIQVKSSASFDIPEDIRKNFSEYAENRGQDQNNLFYHNKVRFSCIERNFLNSASAIERCLLLGLEQSLGILKLPNCSTFGSEKKFIPNTLGIVTALVASVTLGIQSFKDVTSTQRSALIDELNNFERKLQKIRNPTNGITNAILINMKKVKKCAEKIDASFRSKFCQTGEFPSAEEIIVEPLEPIYGITPMEFVNGLASAISGQVWTMMIGVPGVGVIVKNNNTLESHALYNLPLYSKLNVLFSLSTFVIKLLDFVQTNLDMAVKDMITVKGILKQQIKAVSRMKQSRRNFKGKLRVNKWEIPDYLQGFSRVLVACQKTGLLLTQVQQILDTTNEIMQRVKIYVDLKFRIEPTGSEQLAITTDVLLRALNWHTLDTLTGLQNPPQVPPPQILKRTIKKYQKKGSDQTRYKTAIESKILELEIYFRQLCTNEVAVDVPLQFFYSTTNDE